MSRDERIQAILEAYYALRECDPLEGEKALSYAKVLDLVRALTAGSGHSEDEVLHAILASRWKEFFAKKKEEERKIIPRLKL